jgi:outer membrane receptor for ferrienterochelin and colicin
MLTRKKHIARCISLAIALPSTFFTYSSVAQSQEVEEPDVEIIAVTGIRKSLETAASIKQEAGGIVDAITAEELGKFPDVNIAESLQRVPGVAIA